MTEKMQHIAIKWLLAIITIIIVTATWKIVFSQPSFDPAKVAAAETRMWKAYYNGNKEQIGLELIALLQNQYGTSMLQAKKIAEHLATAAMKFKDSRNNYEEKTLPDLIEAYLLIKAISGESFDPEQVAKAELAWWIARRTKGKNSVEQVGTKIAQLYGLIYGVKYTTFLQAGILRAEAGRLRDSGGKNADWIQVEKLLRQSYEEVEKALEH